MDVKKRLHYDVIIVGAGNAGLIAAIEARNQGASVLLLEKGPRERRGGNSRLSSGQFRVAFDRGLPDLAHLLPDSSLPRGEIEIEPYPKDRYYSDLMRMTEGLADQQWTETLVDESMSVVNWMKEQGFPVWGLNPATQIKIAGGKLYWPAGEAVLTSGGSGETLVEGLFGIAEAKKADILYDAAARSLIMDADGGAAGVIAKTKEGMIQVDGKAVILACGGFEASPEMRRSLLGRGWDMVKLRGSRYNTGDGFNLARQAGALICGHLSGAHASVVSEDSSQLEAVGSARYSYPFGIMVNSEGQRFVDEGEDFIAYTYGRMGRKIATQPGAVAYQIFDAKVSPLLRPEYENAFHSQATTLEELAKEIGIDADVFASTVEEYNGAIVSGVEFDPLRPDGLRTQGLAPDKTNWAQPIDRPPFRAFAVVCGLTFTYGGLKVNKKCQVVDTRDMPIEGLYAIGEIAGGLFYHNCPSGAGLVKGAIAGRIAGREAALRAAV